MAGVISRTNNFPISESICSSFHSVLPINDFSNLYEYKTDSAFFIKIDLGILTSKGFHVDDNSDAFSMLVGEPYLTTNSESETYTRQKDLLELHKCFNSEKWDVLQKATGVFAFAYYSQNKKLFSIATDKLGIRPLYVWYNKDFLVFSTILNVFNNLKFVPKVMDTIAVAQIAQLGYPIGRRTNFIGIELLESAEQILLQNDKLKNIFYHVWKAKDVHDFQQKELLKITKNRFISAIRKRLRKPDEVYAFLSGGLDSRCVVSALRSQNVKVTTFGFSIYGSQDDVFGQMFADKVSCFHNPIGRKNIAVKCAEGEWSFLISEAIETKINRSKRTPHLVWSGDGGSVSAGCVYLTKKIVELLTQRKTADAVSLFLSNEASNISEKVLNLKVAKVLASATHNGILNELKKIQNENPVRAFLIFLLKNDQRRHLCGHFETIGKHQVELLLPFFDSDFIDAIFHIPIKQLLYHHFYHIWLKEMDPAVTAVPWQTYPGHEPCPVTGPENLPYQWDSSQYEQQNKYIKQGLIQKGNAILRVKKFPHHILNKKKLWFAHWANKLGLREANCAINTAEIFLNFWSLAKEQDEIKHIEDFG